MSTMQGLRALGEDVDAVLAKHGLELDKMDPNSSIERVREWQIYVDLSRGLHDPIAGLKLGEYFSRGGYGPYVMLLMT